MIGFELVERIVRLKFHLLSQSCLELGADLELIYFEGYPLLFGLISTQMISLGWSLTRSYYTSTRAIPTPQLVLQLYIIN